MGRIKEPSTLPVHIAQPWLIGLAGVAGSVAVALRETSQKDADVAKQ